MCMEQTVLQRIKAVLEDSGKTRNSLANEIGMSPTTVWRQLKGEQAVSLTLIQGFLQAFPEVSAEWLLRGDGEMEKVAEASPKPYVVPDEEDVPTMAAEPLAVRSTSEYDLLKARYDELEKRYDQLIGVLGKGGV